jgi:4-hydroxythreonine-4-phosphate dehydrogenase
LALRAASALRGQVDCVLVGHEDLWTSGAEVAGVDPAAFERAEPLEEDRRWGGGAVAEAVAAAARLALAGRVAGICTAPIDKAELHAAGLRFPGHTEFLAALCGGAEALMILAGPKLRVAPMTTHVALREVPGLLTEELCLRSLRIANDFLREGLGIEHPTLGVAALNPHAGEGGAFGDEEARILEPAIERARAEGLRVLGPRPADTIFAEALRGACDLVVAPTHDQALIAVKVAHFGQVVNVTAGLPLIRTSPDHGTARDLRGTGQADPSSMILALETARQLAGRR